ncbi:NYN domain-containing protein [Myxococcota bacterium]|nr:NYN domain-containing protein [Myxococcota bacterium]MBU1508720.1 NYN domain-containing protein [Myxococcota bacterium]
MANQLTSYAIFIDYDNLLPAHKSSGILDVVTKVLMQVPRVPGSLMARCEVRIYGGWYEETAITRLAENVTIELVRDFPATIRLPNAMGNPTTVETTGELAVALLQEPGHHLFNTYRRKGKPSNIRVMQPASIGCIDPDCILPMVKKLLKKGTCPKHGCNISVTDLVYRHEQKIVDSMLACDLIFAADSGVQHIVLVGGDDDFLPPLRTITLRGASVVRFFTKPNDQRVSFPCYGVKLLEMEL